MTKTERKVVDKRFIRDSLMILSINDVKTNQIISFKHSIVIILRSKLYWRRSWKLDGKLPIHWSSRILKRYKGNSITSDLTRALRISSWAIGLLYLPFYPPNSLKNQNFKRIKKTPGEISKIRKQITHSGLSIV